MKEFRFPKSDMLMGLIGRFNPTEKVIFAIFTVLFIFGGLSLAYKLNIYFSTPIPDYGGSIKEGIIGIPRFINPILAQTDVDRDLTSLVYSGLLRNINGVLVPDLAESYTISDDGLVYSFKLKNNAFFHDGVAVSADDVAYTIEKAQDSVIKSPRRAIWNEVSVQVINSKVITFTLKHPFAPFIYNTTIGILPKHLWKDIDSESFVFSTLNSEPIGSGPYKMGSINHDDRGLPTSYTLDSYKKYTLGRPFINSLNFYFYPNEKSLLEAYYEGSVDNINSVNADDASKIARNQNSKIIHTSLPRTFAVFFNQNQSPVLAQKEVRDALNIAIDKDFLIQDILKGYGVKSDGPLPFPGKGNDSGGIEKAKDILKNAGWKQNSDGIFEKKIKKDTVPLQISLTTTNAIELKRVAELVKQNWEKIGAVVTLKIYENGDLHQNIIRPRKYEALLFGEIVGRDLDLYAYWHSSQRNDPGLNISLYANSKVDKILEDIRETKDPKDRLEKARDAEEMIVADTPAVFLYSPDLIYIVDKNTHIGDIKDITTPTDRFGDVMHWYINTDNVWNIFIKNKK